LGWNSSLEKLRLTPPSSGFQRNFTHLGVFVAWWFISRVICILASAGLRFGMKRNELEKGRISNHSQPVGTVTYDMVRQRAREIAITNGRSPGEVSDLDVDQARRELTTLEEEPVSDQIAEALPESERWDPVPGSVGKSAPNAFKDEEQTDNERLIQEGMEDAEHDQMVKGSIEEAKKDEAG
jgi:hypothetical protein